MGPHFQNTIWFVAGRVLSRLQENKSVAFVSAFSEFLSVHQWSESLTTNHEVPVSIPDSTVGIFLEGEDSRGDHGLGRLVELRLKTPPGTTSSSITTHTSSGQRNCASWASQPQKSVTLLLCPGGRTTKSTKRTCGGTGGKKRKKKKNSHCAHKLLIITRSVSGTK